MGWINFIIIPSFKVAIETSRNINEISDYEIKALNYLTDEERCYDDDISVVKIRSLNVKMLSTLFSSYNQSTNLAGLELDKFLLYWLTTKNIKFEIKSEHNIDRDELKKSGYVIIEHDYTS